MKTAQDIQGRKKEIQQALETQDRVTVEKWADKLTETMYSFCQEELFVSKQQIEDLQLRSNISAMNLIREILEPKGFKITEQNGGILISIK